MNIHKIDDFPYVECGSEPKRLIKLIISPYTTGEERFSIVHVTVPPCGVSNAHIHNDCDEIIYFLNNGKVLLNDEEYEVQKNSIVFAQKGMKHECVNTSGNEELKLYCLFVPPFKPYGIYPELIEKTKDKLRDLQLEEKTDNHDLPV